jgi:hypothetical protein
VYTSWSLLLTTQRSENREAYTSGAAETVNSALAKHQNPSYILLWSRIRLIRGCVQNLLAWNCAKPADAVRVARLA